MIVSLAELIILGILVDWAFRKLTVPGLVGMLFLGVAFGPHALDLVNPDLLTASADLRLIALIVILLRAGFELSKNALHKVGARVLVLSAVPAIIEGVAITFLGPPLLGLTYLQSAVLGSVLAAVSPAVVVPLMIHFIERDMGTEKGIPTMVLAASAIDDVFVIVIYSVLVGMIAGQEVNIAWSLAGIPISIVLGIGVGLVVGFVLFHMFRRFDPRATKRVLVILGLSVILVRVEHMTAEAVPFAALLAVMAIGFIILEKDEHMAHEVSAKLGKIWVFAEIVLFTMVGAQVNIEVALTAGLAGAAVIGLGLVARSVGTWACLLGSDLNRGERLFVVISYLPKATVQAAIGGGALFAMRTAGMDTGPGEIILAVAVLSIVLTAPLGAWAIALAGDRWLVVAPPSVHDAHDAAIESEAATY
jgi:NhaP-type Na+/H+ or K+/H+ antiporter